MPLSKIKLGRVERAYREAVGIVDLAQQASEQYFTIRDRVDCIAALYRGADTRLRVAPNLVLRLRGRSRTFEYRYYFAGRCHWLQLAKHSAKKSGGGFLTFDAAKHITERLDLIRGLVPDLHGLRRRVIEMLASNLDDPTRKAIMDRLFAVLPGAAPEPLVEEEIADDVPIVALDDGGWTITSFNLRDGNMNAPFPTEHLVLEDRDDE